MSGVRPSSASDLGFSKQKALLLFHLFQQFEEQLRDAGASRHVEIFKQKVMQLRVRYLSTTCTISQSLPLSLLKISGNLCDLSRFLNDPTWLDEEEVLSEVMSQHFQCLHPQVRPPAPRLTVRGRKRNSTCLTFLLQRENEDLKRRLQNVVLRPS